MTRIMISIMLALGLLGGCASSQRSLTPEERGRLEAAREAGRAKGFENALQRERERQARNVAEFYRNVERWGYEWGSEGYECALVRSEIGPTIARVPAKYGDAITLDRASDIAESACERGWERRMDALERLHERRGRKEAEHGVRRLSDRCVANDAEGVVGDTGDAACHLSRGRTLPQGYVQGPEVAGGWYLAIPTPRINPEFSGRWRTKRVGPSAGSQTFLKYNRTVRPFD